jgi:hypothetical protein
MQRTITEEEVSEQFDQILDDAENGRTTLVLRQSKLCVAIIPVSQIENFRLFQQSMRKSTE